LLAAGDNVVDTFYVRDASGQKITDGIRRDAISAALISVLT